MRACAHVLCDTLPTAAAAAVLTSKLTLPQLALAEGPHSHQDLHRPCLSMLPGMHRL